jgi:hypothetical protein
MLFTEISIEPTLAHGCQRQCYVLDAGRLRRIEYSRRSRKRNSVGFGKSVINLARPQSLNLRPFVLSIDHAHEHRLSKEKKPIPLHHISL